MNLGLYLNNSSDKKLIIQRIISNEYLSEYVDLSTLKGALHSTITINKLIEEELRHDRFIIQTEENSTLKSMSSGQQKRELLQHLLAQNPEYIILDDVYGNIDTQTQTAITHTLSQLSEKTIIIQLFFRKNDVLPCINTILSICDNNLIINAQETKSFLDSSHSQEVTPHQFELPYQYNETHIDINPLVQLNDVSISYGDKKVLNKINWTIQQGEFWQLKGPNGSGKSTILSLITGDNPKAYGQNIILFGRKKGTGESIWDIKQKIGYFTPSMIEQFQHDDTVENMIISGLLDSVGLYTKPSDLQKDIARSWISMLGSHYNNKSFQQLSIGRQRMVMVARAMVKHPPLLILDEPTIELDDENTSLFINMVNAIATKRKIAILYVSHRQELALNPDKILELVPAQDGSTGLLVL